eukprot:3161126-Amphidinium_carterae.2
MQQTVKNKRGKLFLTAGFRQRTSTNIKLWIAWRDWLRWDVVLWGAPKSRECPEAWVPTD